MKSAEIKNGVVTNIVLGSAPGYIDCADSVSIGDLYSAGNYSKPLVNIAELKAAKNLQINAWRMAANLSTFPYAGKLIACDELSRSDIDAVAGSIALNGTFPAGFPNAWKATDNTFLSIPDIATFKVMYAAMTVQGTANFTHSQSLKTALAAAITQADIDAITW